MSVSLAFPHTASHMTQASNTLKIGSDYATLDFRNLPYSWSRRWYRNPSNDHRRRELRSGHERRLCAVRQT